MKKSILAFVILLAAGTGAIAQKTTHKSATHHHKMATSKHYTCSMHPEVVTSKPGKCPKCGMKLVAMKSRKTTKNTKAMKM